MFRGCPEVKTDVSSYVQKFKAQQKNAGRKIVSFAEDVVTDAGDTWKLCKEETKRHIVLVIDTSGSMRLCDVNVFDRLVPRIEAVRLTALEFLAAQEDTAVYSVVSFDHVAKVAGTDFGISQKFSCGCTASPDLDFAHSAGCFNEVHPVGAGDASIP